MVQTVIIAPPKKIPDDFEMISTIVLATDCSDDAASYLLAIIRNHVNRLRAQSSVRVSIKSVQRDARGLIMQVFRDRACFRNDLACDFLERGLAAEIVYRQNQNGSDSIEIIRQ